MQKARRGTRLTRLTGTRLRLCAGATALLLILVGGQAGWSQASSSSAQSIEQTVPFNPNFTPPLFEGLDPVMAQRRLLALNIERQKEIVSDTNKLLRLAKELNEEIAAANTGILTADQERKLGEIEKLARSVRERMTNGVGQPQWLAPPRRNADSIFP